MHFDFIEKCYEWPLFGYQTTLSSIMIFTPSFSFSFSSANSTIIVKSAISFNTLGFLFNLIVFKLYANLINLNQGWIALIVQLGSSRLPILKMGFLGRKEKRGYKLISEKIYILI